jgi:hypothetical protein
MKNSITARLMIPLGLSLAMGCAAAGRAAAQEVPPCAIEGVWNVPSDRGPGLVEIVGEDGTWAGYPLAPSGERAADYQILRGLQYDAEQGRYEGTLAPPGGREVAATVSCVTADELEITGRRFGMSRSVRWTRPVSPRGQA